MKYLFTIVFVTCTFAQPSRIELKSHYSSTLSTTKEFNIFFPEGYDNETDYYPVVFLFRGAVGEWANPSEDASRKGNIKTVFDSLYTKNKIGKMILVMPGLSAPATNNEYVYLANELLPYIDTHYRTISGRWHRAIDGFSLGGLIVTNLLADAPQLFASVGSYDGTLSLFNDSKFSFASSSSINSIKQIQLLYHTASSGVNNNDNNISTFNILNSKGIANSLPSFFLDPNAQHNWFYADWHMAITLPLHWEKIQSTPNSLHLSLTTVLANQTISGTTQITWSRLLVPNPITTILFYSKDNGKQWTKFYSTSGNDSSFQWNTIPLVDGTQYKIKIFGVGDSLFGSSVSGIFTINNPGNGAPDVEFVNLNERDTIAGDYNLQWFAADADGDPLTIAVDASYDFGSSWSIVVPSISNDKNYLLNSRNLSNGSDVLFRLQCSDGTVISEATSPKLIIANKRINLLNASFIHRSGYSDAKISALGMSLNVIHPADYYIQFKESFGTKTYSVFNSKGVEVVKDASQLDGKTEGPLFDGFRLLINDFPVPVVNTDSSYWIVGASNMIGEVRLIDINTGTDNVPAIPFPSDYEVRISNAIVDTSLSLYDAAAIPLPFLVWNTTLDKKTKFIFNDFDGNGTLSEFDELYLFEKDSMNADILSWHVQFVSNATAVLPVSGDKFKIKIMKPLTKVDSYQFLFTPLHVSNGSTFPSKYSVSQNYPNPFNLSTVINYQIPLNGFVTITVYDLLGRVITILVHGNQAAGNHSVEWNANNVSSGIYFYHFQSGSVVDVKRMMLLK